MKIYFNTDIRGLFAYAYDITVALITTSLYLLVSVRGQMLKGQM